MPDTAVPDTNDLETITPGNQTRKRSFIFVGLLALLAVIGFSYLGWASTRVSNDLADRQERALAANEEFQASLPTPTPALVVVAPTPVSQGPLVGEVMFVNRVPGETYGKLGIRHSDGRRTLLNNDCLRIHAGGEHGICLGPDPRIPGAFVTSFFELENPAAIFKEYGSPLPSRTRISPSGRFSSVTAFISGSSYDDISTDSETAVLIDEIDVSQSFVSVSSFEVPDAAGERYEKAGSQFWGASWIDDDGFYITGFYDDFPEVMLGSLNDRSLTPTGFRGSCPSLSPDGTTLVFKETQADGTHKLVAVDLATETQRDLGETRSVDDQVEWLDNDTILYALHTEDGDVASQPGFDVWVLDLAEGSEPELFLPNADSPAVVR